MANLHAVLREMFDLLSERNDLTSQLQRIPVQRKGRQNEHQKFLQQLQVLRDQLRALRKQIDAQELSLKAAEEKLFESRTRLNQAKTPKEYEALQQQIQFQTEANSKIEEEVFGLMNQQEELEQQIQQGDQEKIKREEELQKFNETLDYKVQKFTERVQILEGFLQTKELALDNDTRADYRRLVKSNKENPLAPCIGGACQACFSQLTPQTQTSLAQGKRMLCSNCGVLLFL